MSIHKAINGVMSEIGAIEKNKQQQGFKYRGIDDVMNALQPLLVKHGVFIVPEIMGHEREERTTKNGGNLIYTVCTIRYTFYASDGSSVCAVVVGEAMDSGDKSTNKAMSVAFKYACFQVFCIPTEEMADPDAESPPESAPAPAAARKPEAATGQGGTITEAQAKRMYALSGGDAELCRAVIASYGYAKSMDVRIGDYEAICIEIEMGAADRLAAG